MRTDFVRKSVAYATAIAVNVQNENRFVVYYIIRMHRDKKRGRQEKIMVLSFTVII